MEYTFPPLNLGDIVLFVVLESASGSKNTTLERNPRDVSAIVDVDSLAITTRDYFSKPLEVERTVSLY